MKQCVVRGAWYYPAIPPASGYDGRGRSRDTLNHRQIQRTTQNAHFLRRTIPGAR